MGLFDRLRGGKAMTPAQAAEESEAGAVLLVDVRSSTEFTGGHAPAARHVPLESLSSQLPSLSSEERPVAFICHSGMRSASAARQGRKAGLDARNVRGGMIAWQRAGLPTKQGKGKKRKR